MARLIAEMDTLTPLFCSHSWQWRSRVASSFSSSCFHKAFFSSGVERMRRLLPVETPGERFLPSLLIFSQRLRVVREMEKISISLPSGDTLIHRCKSPDPQVLRVDVHERHSYTGPLYSQTALVSDGPRTRDLRSHNPNSWVRRRSPTFV